jgi:hypothetical protein
MPNRIVREAINASERIDQLSPLAELFYRRLLNVVDDFGRFEARTDLLRLRTYPLRHQEIADNQVLTWLHECTATEPTPLVVLYQVSGKAYLEVQEFKQQVRAKHSAFPSPREPAAESIPAADIPVTGKRPPRGQHATLVCVAGAAHVRSRRASSAHSDVDVCEGEGDGKTKGVGLSIVATQGKAVGPPGEKTAGEAGTKKGTRLPDDWVLPGKWGAWALQQDPTLTPDEVRRWAAKFKNHWIAKPGKDGLKLSWKATWENWCHTELERRSRAPASTDKHAERMRVSREMNDLGGNAHDGPTDITGESERVIE